MRDETTCFVWCDECCGENWDEVSRWIHDGRATAKSGRLKVAAACSGCGAVLRRGDSAEAVTVHDGAEYRPWEVDYLEVETGWERITSGGELQGRVK